MRKINTRIEGKIIADETLAWLALDPRRLEMSTGMVPDIQRPNLQLYFFARRPKNTWPPCNSVGCFAGWVVERHDPALAEAMGITEQGDRPWRPIQNRACELLGISPADASHLFYVSSWPEEFNSAFILATTAEEKLEVLKRRVEHFYS